MRPGGGALDAAVVGRAASQRLEGALLGGLEVKEQLHPLAVQLVFP
jgi:hypothetical protein